MQLTVTHYLQSELRLPLGYHHIVQSALYHCLGQDEAYSAFLHDRGYANAKRSYKMFTFGLLRGAYAIENREIVFRDTVTLEIRSVEAKLIRQLADSIQAKGITYRGQTCRDVDVRVTDETVEGALLLLKMDSPICVYSTDPEQKTTHYFAPSEPEFCEMVNRSFARKYRAYTGVEPESDIFIEPYEVTERNRSVTRYKGIYITAWSGTYVLSGERRYLDFLYQTGLGSKTSQGFGMFGIVGYLERAD
jgi:CRISPR-associated endoribonuclease Cas6